SSSALKKHSARSWPCVVVATMRPSACMETIICMAPSFRHRSKEAMATSRSRRRVAGAAPLCPQAGVHLHTSGFGKDVRAPGVPPPGYGERIATEDCSARSQRDSEADGPRAHRASSSCGRRREGRLGHRLVCGPGHVEASGSVGGTGASVKKKWHFHHAFSRMALVGFQGRRCADDVQQDWCHTLLFEALIFSVVYLSMVRTKSGGDSTVSPEIIITGVIFHPTWIER